MGHISWLHVRALSFSGWRCIAFCLTDKVQVAQQWTGSAGMMSSMSWFSHWMLGFLKKGLLQDLSVHRMHSYSINMWTFISCCDQFIFCNAYNKKTWVSEIRALFNWCTSMVFKFMKLNMTIAPSWAAVSLSRRLIGATCHGKLRRLFWKSCWNHPQSSGIYAWIWQNQICQKQKAARPIHGRAYHALLAEVTQITLNLSKL